MKINAKGDLINLNLALSLCLKSALEKANSSGELHILNCSNEIFEHPVYVPAYMVFEIARALEIESEVFEILKGFPFWV